MWKSCRKERRKTRLERIKKLLNQTGSSLTWRRVGKAETVSLWMTDKVSSAASCRLYQLFPHCVRLSRRWAAPRCPQGLERRRWRRRRRTGRGAWRDKNLISSQPFRCLPLPSSHPQEGAGADISDTQTSRASLLFLTRCWTFGGTGVGQSSSRLPRCQD